MNQPVPGEHGAMDPLTGLLGRTAFRKRLEAACKLGAQKHRHFGLVLFDIDHFKVVNYGFGEQHGDSLLQAIATLAQQLLRRVDNLSRWGGQEFLALLPDADKVYTEDLAGRLQRAIQALCVQHEGVMLQVTASLATASFPKDGDNADRLLAALGAALHQAKTRGNNKVVPASSLHPQLFGVGRMLHQAIQEGRVLAVYQPIVDLDTGDVVADEALARIVSPNNSMIPASAFIDVARELRISHLLDRAVLLQTSRHRAANPPDSPRTHFVNISGPLLSHPQTVKELLGELHDIETATGKATDLNHSTVIEVTERELREDLSAARRVLQPFLEAGMRLALVGFGTGQSSYKFLADLPFSFLRIHGSLIRRVAEPRVRCIVQGIQKTAVDLGLVSIAEHIENAEIAHIARDIGIDWGLGYHFGKPVLPTEMKINYK